MLVSFVSGHFGCHYSTTRMMFSTRLLEPEKLPTEAPPFRIIWSLGGSPPCSGNGVAGNSHAIRLVDYVGHTIVRTNFMSVVATQYHSHVL